MHRHAQCRAHDREISGPFRPPMTVGRKPKPSHLKVVENNPGKRAINRREPKPKAGATPPAGMSDRALSVWSEVAPMLERMGVLTVADALALSACCEAYADMQSARISLQGATGGAPSLRNGEQARLHAPHAPRNRHHRRCRPPFSGMAGRVRHDARRPVKGRGRRRRGRRRGGSEEEEVLYAEGRLGRRSGSPDRSRHGLCQGRGLPSASSPGRMSGLPASAT